MAIGKMLKKDYKQLGEAVNDYRNGINIGKQDFQDAITAVANSKTGRLTNEELLSMTKGQRYAYGVISAGKGPEAAVGFARGANDYKTDHWGAIRSARDAANSSSDIAAAGRLAAVGVTGFAATAGVLNLVRGDY